MNWFTTHYVRSMSQGKKAQLVAEHDCCEHVGADSSLAFVISREHDSFGSEGYVTCESCYEQSLEEEDNSREVCHDCSQTVLRKEGYFWKWYDFYAPQGDEPLFICHECAKKEKHTERIRRDREEYEAEMAYYDRD